MSEPEGRDISTGDAPTTGLLLAETVSHYEKNINYDTDTNGECCKMPFCNTPYLLKLEIAVEITNKSWLLPLKYLNIIQKTFLTRSCIKCKEASSRSL